MLGFNPISASAISDAQLDILISATGAPATGASGSVAIDAKANVPTTGLSSASAVGNVTVAVSIDVVATGLEATSDLNGAVTVTGTANISPTGVSADALTPSGGSEFTADGNAQLSTAQAKFGSASLLLDGTDDFVTSDENIDLSSGDFTVDMWIRPTTVTGYKGLWQSGTSTTLNAYLIGDQVRLTVGGSTIIFTSATRVSANVWTMISIERDGNNHRLYINGTLEETGSTGNRPDDGVFAIGKNGFGDFNGYIDELRLSSVARYGGTSFTEPTSNYAVDGDTTALLHFDGTNGSTDIINETEGGAVVKADANMSVTGLSATMSVGSVAVSANATVFPTLDAVSGQVGSVDVEAKANVSVTGLSVTSSVGSVTVTGSANVFPTTVTGFGQVGQALVWSKIDPNQNPSYTPVTPSQSTLWSEIDPAQSTTWTKTAA